MRCLPNNPRTVGEVAAATRRAESTVRWLVGQAGPREARRLPAGGTGANGPHRRRFPEAAPVNRAQGHEDHTAADFRNPSDPPPILGGTPSLANAHGDSTTTKRAHHMTRNGPGAGVRGFVRVPLLLATIAAAVSAILLGCEQPPGPVVDPPTGELSFDGTVSSQTYEVGTAIEPLPLPRAKGGKGPWAYTCALTPISVDQSARGIPGLECHELTLTGTPTLVGTYRVTVRVTDANDDTAELTFTVTVVRSRSRGESTAGHSRNGVRVLKMRRFT